MADATEALQPLADGQVALMPAVACDFDRFGKVRLEQPVAVQQHVHHAVADRGGELAAGHDLDPEALPGRPGLGHGGDRVMVGHGQHPDPGRGRGGDQLTRAVAAVAGQGVGVQVDQGAGGCSPGPPPARHGR